MCLMKSVEYLRDKSGVIKKYPGIYRLWIEHDAYSEWKNTQTPSTDKLLQQTINDKVYYAIYIGISKNLNDRIIQNHINGKHTYYNVSRGFLSTLRQSLSSILEKDMTQSESYINTYLDAHCYFEWFYTSSHTTAKLLEISLLSKLSDHCYPLNIEDNQNLGDDWIKELKSLRRKYKK